MCEHEHGHNLTISVNRLRNWLSEDPLIDWLELWGAQIGFQKSNKPVDIFQRWILTNGINWENDQIEKIRTQTAIASKIFSNTFPATAEEYEIKTDETIRAIRNKIPIIIHPFISTTLHQMFPNNESYQTRNISFCGIPDILIHRSLFERLPCLQHITFPADGEYIIGDWKYSTMTATADGKLRPCKKLNGYFAQVWMYQCALNAIFPKSAVREFGGLLPKEFRIGIKGNRQTGGLFESTGLLTCHTPDSLHEYIHSGIEWLWKCHHDGSNWDPRCDFKQIHELRPNLKNHRDGEWHLSKVLLARIQHDLTQLPFVTPTVRKRALDNNDVIEFNPSTKRAKILYKSIVNLQSTGTGTGASSWDEEIQTMKGNYTEATYNIFLEDMSLYRWIDFEFISAGWLSKEERIRWNRIELFERHPICALVGWTQKPKNDADAWIHVQHELAGVTRENEKQLWEYIQKECDETPGIKWVHWGCTEKTMFKHAFERGDIREMPHMLDLMGLFQGVQFLPTPLLNFSLKAWGNHMYKNELLPRNFPKLWTDNESDVGNFWIPEYVKWFQGGKKPNPEILLSYHRRDIYWLAAIHDKWFQSAK